MRFATFPSWNCPCWVLFVTFQYISATFLFACYFSHVGAEPFMFKLFKACTGWNQTFCILFARLWRWNPIVFFFESRDSSHPLCFGWQQIQNPWQESPESKTQSLPKSVGSGWLDSKVLGNSPSANPRQYCGTWRFEEQLADFLVQHDLGMWIPKCASAPRACGCGCAEKVCL